MERSVEAGDRYPTDEPCGPSCVSAETLASRGRARGEGGPQGTGDAPFLAVEPYSFIFRAPVKGRWLDRALLEVCAREFAYVPPPLPHEQVSVESATLDRRRSIPAYVEELADGHLWLHSRETECRQVGEHYKRAMAELCAEERAVSADVDASARWQSVRAWMRALPSEADADALLQRCDARSADWKLATAPSSSLPLLLRQKDTLLHRVWRQEGRVFAGEPLHLLRCDLRRREANRRGTATAFRPALLALRKPAGLPVHPSGRYRKNSCSAILEDIFGGCDRHRYTIQEEPADAAEVCGRAATSAVGAGSYTRVSVVHRTYGFTIITAVVREHANNGNSNRNSDDDDDSSSSSTASGVERARSCSPCGEAPAIDRADWELLASLHRQEAHGSENPQPLCPLKVHVVHRLDAATSGVLLFGLDQRTARESATAIANKGADGDEDEEDEENVGGAREDARDSNVSGVQGFRTVSGAPAPRSTKEYMATVHGRLDTEERRQLSSQEPLVAHSPAGSDAGERWLLVDRPIGCVSFHKSLYWVPGEAGTRCWRVRAHGSQVQRRAATAAEGDSLHSPAAAAEALAAKHERMRQLTRGSKRQRAHAADAAPGTQSAGDETAFEETLRGARTLLRTARYDSATDQTVVVCRLLTGRTHQLRVHLASLGHPIVGDRKYEQLWQWVAKQRPQPSLACPADDELPDVVRDLCRRLAQPSSSSGSDESSVLSGLVAYEGCACPESIELHAWHYQLRLPRQGGSRDGGKEELVDLWAPPHSAAMSAAASTFRF